MQQKISNYMYNMGLPGFNQVFTGRLENQGNLTV